MHTSLSDAFHFLVAVLWCSGLSVPSGMCLFQLGSSVELSYFRGVPALAGLSCRPESS